MIISKEYKHTFLDYPHPIHDAVIVSFVGCEHACPECQNYGLQHYNDIELALEKGGRYEKIESCQELYHILKRLVMFYKTNYIIFQGGDPFYEKNREIVSSLLRLNSVTKEFNICIYTGYNEEQVKSFDILSGFEYIKCGLFDITKYQEPGKTDDRISFASTNQVLFDKNWKQLSHQGVYTFYE